jgi:hypothetical protein
MGTKFGLLTPADAFQRGFIPARIFVNGIEYDRVKTVNDVEGWIEIYSRHPIHGCPYVEYENGDPEKPSPTERVYGDVVYVPAGMEVPYGR